MFKPCNLLFVAMLIATGVWSTAQAQPVVNACNMNCPAPTSCAIGDLNCPQQIAQCQANQASCQVKYDLYNAYLTQMGMGVTLNTLPQRYRDVLGPHFPNANLAQVSFGYSSNQPPDNATTDCDKIYFNDASYVSQLQNGTVEEDFYWLLHELRHFEQCGEVGGRDNYAKMWWDHLSETDLQGFIQSGNWDAVHDQMAMESNANAVGNSVQGDLEDCCIHPSTGYLIRPLQVSSVSVSPQTINEGNAVTFSVNASDGADPLVYEWSVKAPGSGFFTPVASSATASFTPDQSGVWEVRVRVLQAGGASASLNNNYEETQSFTVESYVPIVTNLTLSKSSISHNETIQGTVQVAQISAGAGVIVTLSSSSGSINVPPTVAVVAVSGHSGTQTFDITAGLAPPHTATITASVGGSSKSASLTVEGPTLEQVEVDPSVLYAEEWFNVRILLDQPPSTPITVLLESSDARLVSVPRKVTFQRGEREKTLRAQVGRDVRRESTVMLRARMERGSQRAIESQVRVRPRGTAGRSG